MTERAIRVKELVDITCWSKDWRALILKLVEFSEAASATKEEDPDCEEAPMRLAKRRATSIFSITKVESGKTEIKKQMQNVEIRSE